MTTGHYGDIMSSIRGQCVYCRRFRRTGNEENWASILDVHICTYWGPDGWITGAGIYKFYPMTPALLFQIKGRGPSPAQEMFDNLISMKYDQDRVT